MLDHPENLRHPARWYMVPKMSYMSPAVIHDGPHTIKAGETLRLRYRAIVYPDTLDAAASEKEWAAWKK